MNWGIKGDEWGSECRKRGREVKTWEHSFTLLPSLLHPVLIDTEALKEMSAWAESMCVCVCVDVYIKIVYLSLHFCQN